MDDVDRRCVLVEITVSENDGKKPHVGSNTKQDTILTFLSNQSSFEGRSETVEEREIGGMRKIDSKTTDTVPGRVGNLAQWAKFKSAKKKCKDEELQTRRIAKKTKIAKKNTKLRFLVEFLGISLIL